jgi:curved DNA-binding protein CbpA
MKNYYQILGVPENAALPEIRERYRLLVASCHPDKFQEMAQKLQAEEHIKEVNEAYDVLRDPVRRANYDRERGASSARSGVKVTVRRPVVSSTPPVQDLRAGTPVIRISGEMDVAPEHLGQAFLAARGDRVRVWLDRRANVLLLDESDYLRYRRGDGFRYLGGYARYSPVDLYVPYPGRWYLVVDLGGAPVSLRVRAEMIRAAWW